MNQNQLFNRTRASLACSYAVVMGLILGLLGLGVYRAIAHAHLMALDNELESLAGTLHDSIELKLEQPGRIEPIVKDFFPNLCKNQVNCQLQLPKPQHHILSPITQGNYYIRFLDTSGSLLAVAGTVPEGLPQALNKREWQTLSDNKGISYHQITVLLHTQNGKDWGYFQMGRSFKEFEDYLGTVKLILKLGLPISLVLVGGASWWLSGFAMQPIYKSYRQIEQFTADAAHELRTPLAATQATVESALLMQQLDEKEAQDILATVQRQTQRLTQLVADLLLLTRMDKQTASIHRGYLDLNDIISDSVEEVAMLAMGAKVKLKSEIRVEQPLQIIGDEDQIYRLISNLIINGIQYTPDGGEVKVCLDCCDNYAIIQVQDTGIGIAPNEQKRIFDRFYRVSSDRSRSTGGSGLGLAIVQAIVSAHHGSIQVQSQLGKGSSFIVQLPLESKYKVEGTKLYTEENTIFPMGASIGNLWRL
ncbi:MAG: HAMP domain-containing histidine kinase [Cyanomargarita calcarea GSE-NOS-MK-12-04C]|jgi:two-component system OmpR family sensor kinase|uniref:histidine kinase n=1 Tax=Cyanomargarita calcarea GSE-NOS-MK-12-04C TaxID=2839659 RepID=A0A951UU13_9CYAN|nr:HAMP domain-containing histidine kinase [Cyanomargarita calcarea GSE-NOS-MK-12-04C]